MNPPESSKWSSRIFKNTSGASTSGQSAISVQRPAITQDTIKKYIEEQGKKEEDEEKSFLVLG